MQRFDPATGQWARCRPCRAAVTDSGAAIVGGQLITVGGETLGTVFNTVRAYNLTSQDLVHPAEPGRPRHGLGVAAIGNTLYAIDGAAQPGHTASTSTVQTLTVPPAPAQPAGPGSWGIIRGSRFSRRLRRCWVAGSGWLVA